MIRAEQIPDVCAQEAYRVWFKQGATWKDVVAAALNAWPGMSTGPNIYGRQDAVIHLPLPQESEETDWGKPQGKEEW